MPTTLYKGFVLDRVLFPLLHGNSKCANAIKLDPVNCIELSYFYSLELGIADVQEHGHDLVSVCSLLPMHSLLI